MTKRILEQLLMLSIIMTMICCTPRVIHFSNEKATFLEYETYAVLNLKKRDFGISHTGNQLYELVENGIAIEMDRRSYSLSSNANLVVRYELVSSLASQSVNNTPINQFNPIPLSNRVNEEAALLLEMIDTKTKKVIWQASVDLPNFDRKSKQEESLKQAITRLFDTYLYSAKSNKPDQSLKQGK